MLKKSLNILLTILRKLPTPGNYIFYVIHKRLSAVPGRPVISNWDTPAEKFYEYLDYILKAIMQDSWSYIKYSGDFLKKIESIGKIPEGAILVTAKVIGLYPSISPRG